MKTSGLISQQEFSSSGYSNEEAIGYLMTNNLLKVEKSDLQKIFGIKQVSLGKLFNDIVLAKEIAKQRKGRRIVVTAMPKSGSSLLQTIFSENGYTFAGLNSINDNPTASGQNNRPDEIDELSLIRNWFIYENTVSQHHILGTRYTYSMLSMYNYDVIVTWRNIFDCIISVKDMITSQRISGYPAIINEDFFTWDEERQLNLLCFQCAPWYINFFKSWKSLAEMGAHIHFVSYDKMLSKNTGDSAKLVSFLYEQFGIEGSKSLNLINSEKVEIVRKSRKNVGISGRGKLISESNRKYVTDMGKTLINNLTDEEEYLLFS